MEIWVNGGGGTLSWCGRSIRCAIGRSGLRADKQEGDGATPIGNFALRRVFYRPDRLAPPLTELPIFKIESRLGWCDDPADPAYNQLVTLPFAASHERLWRDDGVYDLLAVIGWNDQPVTPGRGSAIFLHVATPDFAPTAGCIAVDQDDLSMILAACRPGDRIRTTP